MTNIYGVAAGQDNPDPAARRLIPPLETLHFMDVGVIIPAAGSGQRMRGGRRGLRTNLPKQFQTLERVPILVRTIAQFAAVRSIRQVLVALPAAHRNFLDRFIRRHGWAGRVLAIVGGDTRQASVAVAFAHLTYAPEVVLVHDAVRPFVDPALIRRVIQAAYKTGAAIPTVPPTDTLKRVLGSVIAETIPRAELCCAQTPQGFHTQILGAALAKAAQEGFDGTDEASLVERLGHPVYRVPGSEWNFKITRPVDLMLARAVLKEGKGLVPCRL